MKIYRLAKWSEQNSSEGFEFFTSKAKAKKELSKFKKQEGTEGSSIQVFAIDISSVGIIKILEEIASHPDNG